jgi:hypothetical protein
MRSQLTGKPGPDTAHRVPGVWDGRHIRTVPGRVACDSRLCSGHPTMRSRSRSAKSVGEKYLFCGVENRSMW